MEVLNIIKKEYSKKIYEPIREEKVLNDLIADAQAGDIPSRDKVIYSFARMASKEAESGYNNQKPRHAIPLEDFYQASIIGLLSALNNFNPEKGYKFSTYATHCIKGGDGIRGMQQRDRMDIYIPHDAIYHKDKSKAEKASNILINRIDSHANEDSVNSYSWLRTNLESPSESLERVDAVEQIHKAMDTCGLTEVEKFAVYGTFRELSDDIENLYHVAKIFNITHEGARKAGQKGIKKLQKNKKVFSDLREIFYT